MESGRTAVFLLVQKLTAFGEIKPVPAAEIALTPNASARNRVGLAAVPPTPNWYCLRLPSQRGPSPPSGRNIPMNTWFKYVPCVFALTGRLDDAKTLLTAAIS